MRRTVLLMSILALAACKKKASAVDPLSEMDGPVVAKEETKAPAHVEEMKANFAKVHFDTDSYALDEEGRKALMLNANLMGRYPDVKVEVQGHADERGTTDYNMALGQNRAQAVVNFITKQGVAASRVAVISFGEEVPVNRAHTQTAWSQNRRAEFRVTWGEEVAGTVQ